MGTRRVERKHARACGVSLCFVSCFAFVLLSFLSRMKVSRARLLVSVICSAGASIIQLTSLPRLTISSPRMRRRCPRHPFVCSSHASRAACNPPAVQ